MDSIQELIILRGEDIREKVAAFVLDKKWDNAFIAGGIGSIMDATFTVPTDKSFPPVVRRTYYDGPGELLALTGEIMKRELMDPALAGVYADSGPLFVHIHASAAFGDGTVRGGGLHGGVAFRQVKVYLQHL